ncbi:hypothetical protein EZV62_016837 [Acer yangbiense]|uniref:F-box associated beta-propeller type 1 domain-containing protein n=1 Tax=Acer yangbiense TaxID=1000413 RepID=A0A5C7HQG4_9ROSI|nr:hypothetical protein EZV62_016837 [Acer yangbiense]
MSTLLPELIIEILLQSIDDYKLVRVDDEEKILHVFSLRNNSWKILEGNFPIRNPNFLDGVSINGAIHWGAMCYSDNLGEITVFDLAEEKFKTFPLPISNPPNPFQVWLCIVHVSGEYLCVTFEEPTTEFVEAVEGIWITKEYGVKESWIRIVKPQSLHNPIPLCFWENDGIILWSSVGQWRPVLCCDEKDGKIRKELVFDVKYGIYAYVESLVSPNYNLDSTTQGFPHNIAPSELQSTSQEPSSSPDVHGERLSNSTNSDFLQTVLTEGQLI